MGTYHQLTEHQRYQMYALKKAGHDQQSIAATVSVSPSTISRELRRNQGQRGYRPGQAHHKALARRRDKAKATKMTPVVIARIEADLCQQWSPEQIAGRLAATDGLRLSAERICTCPAIIGSADAVLLHNRPTRNTTAFFIQIRSFS